MKSVPISNMLHVLVLFLFNLCYSISETCDSSHFENFLGTRTPYRSVGNTTFGKMEYEGCKAAKSWMMIRHGTRNPSKKFINLMNERLPEIRDIILNANPEPSEYLHHSGLQGFKRWSSKLLESDSNKLTHEGEDEMILLAERMQSRFGNIFSEVYSNTSYRFKFTASQRTKRSAKYFAVGLFGKPTAKKVWYPEPLSEDPILRFYKLCPKWKNSIKNNPETHKSRNEFNSGTKMTQIVNEINKRLKLNNVLDHDDVQLIYSTCGYETAWHKSARSPWCFIFSLDDLKALEYSEDVKKYWTDGYAYKLSSRQACVAFNDMISTLKSKEANPKATVYFSHLGTILKLLAHVELYKEDAHLTSKEFERKMDNRTWRMSRIGSFGTNLAFILHQCKNTYKLLVMHQEKIVRLPSCPHTDLCDLNDILRYYRDSVENCNFSEFCANDEDDEVRKNIDDRDSRTL